MDFLCFLNDPWVYLTSSADSAVNMLNSCPGHPTPWYLIQMSDIYIQGLQGKRSSVNSMEATRQKTQQSWTLQTSLNFQLPGICQPASQGRFNMNPPRSVFRCNNSLSPLSSAHINFNSCIHTDCICFSHSSLLHSCSHDSGTLLLTARPHRISISELLLFFFQFQFQNHYFCQQYVKQNIAAI